MGNLHLVTYCIFFVPLDIRIGIIVHFDTPENGHTLSTVTSFLHFLLFLPDFASLSLCVLLLCDFFWWIQMTFIHFWCTSTFNAWQLYRLHQLYWKRIKKPTLGKQCHGSDKTIQNWTFEWGRWWCKSFWGWMLLKRMQWKEDIFGKIVY